MFQISAEAEESIADGDFDLAYGVLAKQMQLGEKGNFAPLLINYYTTLVSTFRFDEANKIKLELFEIIKTIMRATPKDCELLGDRYMNDRDFIKAILFYQAGEALYKKGIDTDEIINCLQGLALGLKIAAGQLMKKRPDLRMIVAKVVVLAMRCIYNDLSGMFSAEANKMVLVRSLCLHHIETTELIAEDNRVREETLREAVELMERAFGERASKYNLYSSHLNNLAVTCMTQERPGEAIEIFEKAIDSRLKAEDYKTDIEKQEDLVASEDGLRKAKEMLSYMAAASENDNQ